MFREYLADFLSIAFKQTNVRPRSSETPILVHIKDILDGRYMKITTRTPQKNKTKGFSTVLYPTRFSE